MSFRVSVLSEVSEAKLLLSTDTFVTSAYSIMHICNVYVNKEGTVINVHYLTVTNCCSPDIVNVDVFIVILLVYHCCFTTTNL